MKKIFLTSNLDCSVKIDGIRVSKEINNINGVIGQIKKSLTSNEKMVFFVSNPNDYDKNDNYANVTFESFRKSGISFNNEILIDNRYNGDIAIEVKTADLIFLSGGKTKTQMEWFKKIGLSEILKDYSGVIIGQSAGAMNLANEVLCPPEDEEEIGQDFKWLGLNETNINIEPHFVLNITDELDIKLRNELLKISAYRHLYAIPDGSHIFIDELSPKLYGEAYLIENANITKINDTGLTIDISQPISDLTKKL